LDVLYGGIGIKILQFFLSQKYFFFPTLRFYDLTQTSRIRLSVDPQLYNKHFCTDEAEAGPSQPLGKRKGPPQEELYSEDDETETESDLGSIPAMTPFSNLLSMD
jgi:hypothetical protein